MADRYWVGGTASWDGTAGTKWATTSGGTGGASVPTTADDVFFTNLSTGTCTIAAGNTGAKSINCTGFTGTITGTAAISVAGSVTLSAGMTYSHTGTMTFTGTGTLTTAGKQFSGIEVAGSGITITLGGALSVGSRTVNVIQGTFTTADYSLTTGFLASSNTFTRTINLGSSTVTITSSSAIDFSTSTNLTFNAGTSQINLSSTSAVPQFGSQTFYNVSFTSTNAGTRSITGANTFNNLTLTASATGLSQLTVSANQTINGTFTCQGSSEALRGFVRSDVLGTARTLTVATLSANNCDFRDITIAGGAAGTAPTGAGNCGGNSGITFPAAKTVYRVGTSTVWASTGGWAATSGGVGSGANIPLAQDTAIINEDTALTGTLTISLYNMPALDCSNRTTGITLDYTSAAVWHGSHTLGSGVTVIGSQPQAFSGRGTSTFTSAGKTITFPITVEAPGGTFILGDAFSSSNSITHIHGTFNANNYNLTCTTFASNNTTIRTITMGSGLWTLSGTGTVWSLQSTNLTFNKNTANILLSNTTTASRTFTGGGLSYNKLTIGGAAGVSITTIGGGNSFTEIASTKTVAHTVRFSASQGTIGTWSITGSAGNVVTVDSNTAGTRRNFTLTNITSGIDYLSVKDIGELSGNKFYVGANSTNGGNNSNVYFTTAPAASSLIYYGSTNVTSIYFGSTPVTAIYYGSTKVF